MQDEVGSLSEEQLRKFGMTSGDNQLTCLGHQDTVESRKIGSENAIVVRLPTRRFDGKISSDHTPLVDERDCYRIMLLAQNCTRCSFGDEEAGSTKELHMWLQVGSSTGGPRIENADLMLPSKSWLAMLAATNNPVVAKNFRSFGFDPILLVNIELHESGGSVVLQDDSRLEWTISGSGRGPATAGVHHALIMPDDRPNVAEHHVGALITDAVMEQPGELQVYGSALEPFLLAGERLTVLVHSMPKLVADIVWQRRLEAA